MQTVPEFIESYATDNPNHFMTAANHLFDCDCMDCVTFLWTTGHSSFPTTDPNFKAISKSLVQQGRGLSHAQTTVLRALFDAYL